MNVMANFVIVDAPAARIVAANVMASAVINASAASDVLVEQKVVIALNATVVPTKNAAKPAPVQSALSNFWITSTRPIVF